MIEAGETDIAVDELRWLISGCRDFIIAHRLLGELALMENDVQLARGHFAFAFKLGTDALKQHARAWPVPYEIEANRAFLESGKGLGHCLEKLGKRDLAREILKQVYDCDRSDPLGAKAMMKRLEQ